MEEDNDSFRFDQSEEKADMFKGLKLHGVGENHTTEGYLVTDENMKEILDYCLILKKSCLSSDLSSIWENRLWNQCNASAIVGRFLDAS